MLNDHSNNQSGNRDSNPESPAPKAGMLAVTPFPVNETITTKIVTQNETLTLLTQIQTI